MSHPTVSRSHASTPAARQGDGAFVVTCPACGWTHHTIHQRLAELLAAGHRCARYVEARR